MDRTRQLLSILNTSGPLSREELQLKLGGEVSNSTMLRELAELESTGLVTRDGDGKSTTYSLSPKARQSPHLLDQTIHHPFAKYHSISQLDEPILEVTVNNPLSAFRRWLQKLLNNEGIELKFSLKIKPLTAIGIVLIVTALSLGLTTFGVLLKHLPFYPQIQEFVTRPDNTRPTAMRGMLVQQAPAGEYYLFSQGMAEAVVIDSAELELSQYTNKELILSGNYNRETNRFQVEVVSQVMY